MGASVNDLAPCMMKTVELVWNPLVSTAFCISLPQEWRRPKLRSGVQCKSMLPAKPPPPPQQLQLQPTAQSVQHQPLPMLVPNANGDSTAPGADCDSSANNSDKSPSPQKKLSALNKPIKKVFLAC
jgi:hypothetical protein